MTIGIIIVCSRPSGLRECLLSVGRQCQPGDELIAVARPWDRETSAVLDSLEIPLRRVEVYVPGAIHARNTGLAACGAGAVAFLSGDAVAQGNWLARIRERFRQDDRLGVLFGPSVPLPNSPDENLAGPEPGSNMAFRRQILERFDTRKGCDNARVEDAVAAAAKQKGFSALCDPSLAVRLGATGDGKPPELPREPQEPALGLRTVLQQANACLVCPGAQCTAQRRRYCSVARPASVPSRLSRLLDCRFPTILRHPSS